MRDSDDERVTEPRRPDQPVAQVATLPMGARAPESSPRLTVSEALDRPFPLSDVPAERYHILRQLGRGGMGEVNLTFDSKVGRDVALKTMLPTAPAAMATVEARFLREARVQALLDHPAIVPVYDVGVGPGGLAYFTMKRVDGRTLFSVNEELRSGKMSIASKKLGLRRRLVAFITVCNAVHYAHERGVVHRDLKPENVMLGAHGEVYVLDWGVAKLLDGQSGGPAASAALPSESTQPGEMIGTPGFMPPEQVLAQHDEIDPRSDVFALGAILYEILTLRPLLDGKDVMAVMEATLNPTRPDPPPVADAPPELVALAGRCTRFNKSERPSSALDIADAIERYLDGDRDEALRNRLADERAKKAEAELKVALHGPPEDREAARGWAMYEAGRAVALVPGHAGAANTILTLVATPPDKTPREALKEIKALERSHFRGAVRDNAVRIALWMLLAPIPIAMGLRMPTVAAAVMGLLGAAAAGAALLWRSGSSSREARLALYALTCLVVSAVSGIFGPLVLVPGFAAMNTVVFGVQAERNERPLIALMGGAAILVPLALELAGVIPPSMRFEPGSIVLLPRIAEFPPVASLAFLVGVALMGVITPTFITGRVRDALGRVERDLVVQKWQLSQLGPRRGASGAVRVS